MLIILSLYDFSGRWSEPYRNAGFDIIQLDKQLNGKDVRLFKYDDISIYGILAAPPCTMFSRVGNKWERTKEELIDALSMVDVIHRLVNIYRPHFWVFENPVGQLVNYMGPWKFRFHPYEFAGYLEKDKQPEESHQKETLLWGNFKDPIKKPVKKTLSGEDFLLECVSDRFSSIETKNSRSITPEGFAKAFFEANH